MASKFDDGHLHAETDAEEGNFSLASIADGGDHPFDTSIAKSSGDQNPLASCKGVRDVVVGDFFRIDPMNVDSDIILRAGVAECLGHTEVGVVQLGIFAD